jgi:hypothetical protein
MDMANDTAIAVMDKGAIEAIKAHCLVVAKSGLVPDHFAKNPAAVYTAYEMSRVLGEEHVTFMQHVFFIGGKAGMSAQYMLSRMRRRGVIEGTVEYEEEGKGADSRTRAKVVDAVTKRVIAGPWVSMAMAKAEGWTRNSKYSSMPDVMLRARSITFLVRGHYPDVLMGMLTTDEAEDMAAARGQMHVMPGNPGAIGDGGAIAALNAEIISTNDHHDEAEIVDPNAPPSPDELARNEARERGEG